MRRSRGARKRRRTGVQWTIVPNDLRNADHPGHAPGRPARPSPAPPRAPLSGRNATPSRFFTEPPAPEPPRPRARGTKLAYYRDRVLRPRGERSGPLWEQWEVAMDRPGSVPIFSPLLTGTLAGLFVLHPLAMSFPGGAVPGSFPADLLAAFERSSGKGMLPMAAAFAVAEIGLALVSSVLGRRAARRRPGRSRGPDSDRPSPCVRCGRVFSPAAAGPGRSTPGPAGERGNGMCPWCRAALVETLLQGLSRWGADTPTARAGRFRPGSHADCPRAPSRRQGTSAQQPRPEHRPARVPPEERCP